MVLGGGKDFELHQSSVLTVLGRTALYRYSVVRPGNFTMQAPQSATWASCGLPRVANHAIVVHRVGVSVAVFLIQQ